MSTISRITSKAVNASRPVPFALALALAAALAAPALSLAPQAQAQDDIFGEPIPAITEGARPASSTLATDPFAEPSTDEKADADIFSSSDDLDIFGNGAPAEDSGLTADETAADMEAGPEADMERDGSGDMAGSSPEPADGFDIFASPEPAAGETAPGQSAPATAAQEIQPAIQPEIQPEIQPAQAGEAPSRTTSERNADKAPMARTTPARGKVQPHKTAGKKAGPDSSSSKATDVFNQRVKAKLGAERKSTDNIHPLAKRFPDNFTVVCEAGCDGENAHVVYTEPKNARGPIIGPGSNFKILPPEVAKNAVECVGGCYAGRQSYGIYAGAEAALSGAASEDNSWMSNSDTRNNAAQPARVITDPTGARWYDRIDGER